MNAAELDETQVRARFRQEVGAKLAEVATWDIPVFVVEPLDALMHVKNRGCTVVITGRRGDLAQLHAETPFELADSFLETMALLFLAPSEPL